MEPMANDQTMKGMSKMDQTLRDHLKSILDAKGVTYTDDELARLAWNAEQEHYAHSLKQFVTPGFVLSKMAEIAGS